MPAGDTDCLFCRIVGGDVPADVVRESERTLSFRDIDPQAPVHVLVVSREHYPSAGELAAADPQTAAEVLREAAAVASAEGADAGYRIVLNTGEAAGQSVPHVHAHVLGGRALSWPPG